MPLTDENIVFYSTGVTSPLKHGVKSVTVLTQLSQPKLPTDR
jgi:hypothetical protein